MVDEKVAKFKVDTRLISSILGSEIIESYGIAIAEQIKNSADAGSEEVEVDLSNIENDVIIISDKGEGMSSENILEDWFMIGTTHKSEENNLSGGKGIGRFSLFKLGKKIEIETFSSEGKYCFSLSENEIINSDFERLEVPIREGNSLIKTGTK